MRPRGRVAQQMSCAKYRTRCGTKYKHQSVILAFATGEQLRNIDMKKMGIYEYYFVQAHFISAQGQGLYRNLVRPNDA
jgi:hypothetical protein